MRALSISLPKVSRMPMLSYIGTAIALHRSRKHLARLDALQLHDIGLTADQAIAEAARPIWDAPPHWRL